MFSRLNALVAATMVGLPLMVAVPAHAELITNGSFEGNTGNGQIGYNTSVSGWSTGGYNFLFGDGTADTTGAVGSYGGLTLWGPGNGSANGLPSTSPDGGYFIGADGAFGVGAITQAINGLVSGQQYEVGFWFAGAQQSGFNGDTTEQWLVSLGSQTLATDILNDADHGFTGWQHVTLTFTADGADDLLSFLAVGTPDGVPPFALLDGVTMTAVPEPASLTLFGAGLAAMGLIRRRRSRK